MSDMLRPAEKQEESETLKELDDEKQRLTEKRKPDGMGNALVVEGKHFYETVMCFCESPHRRYRQSLPRIPQAWLCIQVSTTDSV